jgi:anaerobic magnesium-protoporphyrin IX monomethyl ester cyclase
MIDLRTIDAGNFSVRAGPARLALVHYGFRTTQMGAAEQRQAEFAPRYPSLGLLNLARSAQVDFENGFIPFEPEFRYFDEDCYADDRALGCAIAEWLRPACARFVMVSLYSLAFDRTAEMLALLDPSAFCIVVGGAHPTVAPRIDFAHVVVRGEGGGALRHILTEFLGSSFGEGAEAAGICFELDGKVRIGRTAFDRSLAKISPPAFSYELTRQATSFAEASQERWWKAIGRSPQIYICTQSCGARCTFCSTYLVHGHFVSRPAELVAADIDHITDLGFDSIQFHDDDLLQHEEFDRLLDLLKERELAWACNARSELIAPPLAKRMFEAGCRKVFLGIESLDQRTLDYYRKATTVEMNQRAVTALNEAGIGVVCGYIIGAPHDTVQSILEDFDRVLQLPIYFLATAILTPDIGTVEFRRAVKEIPTLHHLASGRSGMSVRPRPDLFGTKAPFGLPTVSKEVSKDELNELYALINCEFFLRNVTFEQITRLTPRERLDEAFEWCALQRTRALELADSARIPVVRQRAAAVLSSIGSSSWTGLSRQYRATEMAS